MNYEQKYKEALERARKINSGEGVATHPDWSVCEVIFPELRESEDERIRKEIISFITDTRNWFPKEETKSSWIAWLEKQKEQKQIIAVDSDQLLKILPRTVEWSEEDENHLKNCIAYFRTIEKTSPFYGDYLWLKSLKPQNRWKPSEEQMEALKKRTHGLHTSSETRKALESLINDLKTL